MRANPKNSRQPRLKVLGLAALAMLALNAVAASSAQAHLFRTSVHPAVVTGTTEEGTTHTLTINGNEEICEDVHTVGTQKNEKSESLTLVPDYEFGTNGCEMGHSSATVTVNHCAFVWSSQTEETTLAEFHAHVNIECPEGNEITIEVPAVFVTLHIPAQTTTTHGLRYHNIDEEYEEGKTVKAVTVETTIKNIEVQCTGFACSLLGGENVTGETFATDILTAYEDTGTEVSGKTEATTQGGYSHGNTPIDFEVEGAP